jgi:hypothetical protein
VTAVNDPEVLAAALRWHTAYIKRLTIGAENARRLKAERADYGDGPRRYFGPSSLETSPLVTAAKRIELAALRSLAKVCEKVRANQTTVVDVDVIDTPKRLIWD